MSEITLGDLFNAQLGDNFVVGDKLRDIVRLATNLANWADDKVDIDGDGFAKVYAEHYSQDMRKIAALAEKAVAVLVANGKVQTKGK